MNNPRPIPLKELNPLITCSLCLGYLVDATKLWDCMHTFCRSCIVKHIENSKICPVTNCLKPFVELRPDMTLQTLVYKIVPGLYSKEIQRRDDFYRSTDARASSSCSDDSLFGENNHELEEWIHNLRSEYQFLNPDDSVSLSLEYYQKELDNTPLEKNGKHQSFPVEKSGSSKSDRRYLQCSAAVQMTHLQKFIRMKFGLKDDHKVDIIHNGEVLPTFFTLMDVAYTFKWNRTKPLRFFYRIFSHMKIKPIKIINTTSSGGEKHHQIVAVSSNATAKEDCKETKDLDKNSSDSRLVLSSLEEEQSNKDKERLMNELKLQVRKKPVVVGDEKDDVKKSSHHHQENLFRYGEDNNKEKFAENRDREWELLKNPDEEHKISKKRKKNKHSKDEHKKRKLHAEITSEESLKLKVKLTPHNGYKHKHHKSVGFDQEVVSSKEKINQLRQVRHKSINNEEKVKVEEKKSEEKNEKINSKETKVENSKVDKVVNKKSIQYLPGFTVSRIDNQAKRKIEGEKEGGNGELKKPSLEITLITPNQPKINPQLTNNTNNLNVRRPPPATIPLQKIKNSINFNSGVSIIPKMPEKTDKPENSAPLDLSKPHNNGFKVDKSNLSNLSNLQMLSKVASEHGQSSLNKNLTLKKPQIPNLQSIRLPFNPERKSMPKLNEINKSDFLQSRMLNNSRITRPNQNQCIRNIPNPSLFIKQQNQNRLNCLMQVNNGNNNNNNSFNSSQEVKDGNNKNCANLKESPKNTSGNSTSSGSNNRITNVSITNVTNTNIVKKEIERNNPVGNKSNDNKTSTNSNNIGKNTDLEM